MAPIGVMTHRNMMGGATLYGGGVIYAIIADDQLWSKADRESDALWDAAERPCFTFHLTGRTPGAG